VTVEAAGDTVEYRRPVELQWVKTEDGWLVAGMKPVEGIERVGAEE
jgi:hypothetical protein